jgi:hypothetical protein
MEAPHSTPRLIRVVVCLDSFEKTGAFDRIDAIGACERPFRPSLDYV